MAHTILIADDERKMLDFVKPFLEDEGYIVWTASDGQETLRLVREREPDLVVLDWMMPGKSGIEVCAELRKTSRAGIIMVTARTEEADKLVGLEVGADDYMTKPFSLRELAARIRAVLRRLHPQGSVPSEERLERGELTISPAEYRVWKNGRELSLTPTEYKLLTTLAERPGVVYSRLQLLRLALPDDLLNDERTVDAHISRLRKKVEDDPARPVYIHTVYGFGYRFADKAGGQP
ncbi:response regulator [Paenibacillus thailandensis]|uniref:Response regulator n=1 Tax=Paenibacillus thailandensis TaxID=393250 RepID=A0ABW5R534_9BACL